MVFTKNAAQIDFQTKATHKNIVLKSRRLGFTTYEAIDALDDTLFKQNHDSLIISYDAMSAMDIFDNKVDYAWKNFKASLTSLAGRYKVDSDTKNTLKFEYGNGASSSISVRQSGRSGTYHRVHVSEFGKICAKYPHKAQEIITGTFPAVPPSGRIDIESTAEEAEGAFFEMFMDAWDNKQDFDSIHDFQAHFYNWQWEREEIDQVEVKHDLPTEFYAYRDKMQKEHGIEITDQELTFYYNKWKLLKKSWSNLKQEYPTTVEEAFEVSLEGCYYMKQMREALDGGRIMEFDIEPTLPIFTWWDLGLDDENVVGLFQFYQDEIRLVDVIHNSDEVMGYYLQNLKDLNHPADIAQINLPWDGHIKNLTNKKSPYDIASSPNFFPGKVRLVKNISVMDGINACRSILPRVFFRKNSPGVMRLVKAMRHYKKEWDSKRGVWKNSPNHDWTSHFADMMRYMAIDQWDRKPLPTKPQQMPFSQQNSHTLTDFEREFEEEEESLFTFE